MIYGVCGGPGIAQIAADAGYEYLENSVPGLLKPEADEREFQKALEEVRAAPLPTPACNCFVPGHLKITGPDADLKKLESYVTTVFTRAKVAGVDTIVFGSGGARQIPEGFSRDEANRQIVDFCKMLAPIASENGVTVVVEPLNVSECNVLTTVGESAELVKAVNHPGLQLLVDAYHWGRDNDSYDELESNINLIKHCHIATYVKRVAPGMEKCDFSGFFKALKSGNYSGRLSFEGNAGEEPAKTLPEALKIMKSYE